MAGDAAPADLAFFVIDEAAAGDPAAACMFAPGAFAGPVGLVTLRVGTRLRAPGSDRIMNA